MRKAETVVASAGCQANLRYRFELDGGRLRARLKKGGRTFRSKMERIASEEYPQPFRIENIRNGEDHSGSSTPAQSSEGEQTTRPTGAH